MNKKTSRKTRKTKHVERIECRLTINLLGSTVVPVQDNPFLSSPSYSSSNSDHITYQIHLGQKTDPPIIDSEIPYFSLPYLSNPSIPISSDSSQKVAIRTYQNEHTYEYENLEKKALNHSTPVTPLISQYNCL